jgi:hypothetical protein
MPLVESGTLASILASQPSFNARGRFLPKQAGTSR